MAAEPAPLTRPDYRWEKIIRAIVCGDRATVSEAVETLLTRLRPGLPEEEKRIIRETGTRMAEMDGERLDQGVYYGWNKATKLMR